jgi:hypothetical protein
MSSLVKRGWMIVLTMSLIWSVAGAGIGIASAESTPGSAVNLLQNGGFEEPMDGGTIPGWTIASGGGLAAVSTEQKKAGENSLGVKKLSDVAVGVKMDSLAVNVNGGEEYTLSTDVLIKRGQLAGFYVYVYDESDVIIKDGSNDFTLFMKGDALPLNTWQHLEQVFTIPEGGKTAVISLITSKSTTARYDYYLDNISLARNLDNPGIVVPPTAVRVTSGEPDRLSEMSPITPFSNVVWTAQSIREAGAGGQVDLRFYDSEQRIVSTVSVNIDGEIGVWGDTRLAASAPWHAAFVQSAMHFPSDKSGVYYVDQIDMQIQATPPYITNLGPQSMTTTVMTGAYGKDKNGRDVLYTVVQGDPAKLTVVDVNSGQVKETHSLIALDGSPATAAWGITVASDGKAYIGSTPNGTLFQYDPMKEEVRTLGKPVPGDTVIWVLEAGACGKIYGGTGYSQSIFEYDPAADEMRILTSFKNGLKVNEHVRSLAFDPQSNVLYAGGANVAKLYGYDISTGIATEIPIPDSEGKTSVYDLEFAGGKLFVRVDSGPIMYVYDPAQQEWIVKTNAQYNARGFSPLSPDNRVFYTYPTTIEGTTTYRLYAYNVLTDEYGPIDVNLKGVAVSYGYVELEDPEFPGVSLVGLAGNNGMSFYYNLETGNVKTMELPLPPQFAEIHNIGKSLDGKMLTAGFISGGGLGIYSPVKNETVHEPLMGQIEGYAELNGKMYLGVYPNAALFSYDPKAPWNRTDPSQPNNPLRLLTLGDEQDRPLAMVGVEEVGKLYIGTYPKSGQIGGALSIYEPAANKLEVKRHIVQDHSINTMAYKDGKLYMGTGAMDGTGGKLVIYDIENDEKIFETVPVSGKKALSALTWGPDGNLWGMALGTLFIFDPVTKEVVYQDDKFPKADYSQNNARLLVGTDNHVYGSLYTGYVADRTYTSKMFKLDGQTKEMTVLYEGQVDKLAQDDFGNFYFKHGSLLMKYSDPALVVPMIGAELTLADETLKVGEQTAAELVALLDKGRKTKELSGAEMTFESTDPTVASITETGIISAKAAGNADISATVKLNGVVYQTNKVTIAVMASSDSSGGSGIIIAPPKTEQLPIRIELGGGNGSIEATIVRKSDQNGTVKDELALDESLAKQIIEQLQNSQSRTVVIRVPELPASAAEADEWQLTLSAKSAEKLSKAGITIAWMQQDVQINISADALRHQQDDAYFRLVPLSSKDDIAGIEHRAEQDRAVQEVGGGKVRVVGRPIAIHTNVQGRQIELVLPIRGVAISSASGRLGIYIEHSDGSTELIRGELVKLGADGDLGLRFTADKFSTFAIVEVNGWTEAAPTYMQGYEDGSFRPERSVTRAELAAMLARIVDSSAAEDNKSYNDIPEWHWARDSIMAMTSLGMLKGYPDGSFRPTAAITRGEMAAALLPLLTNASEASAPAVYSDLDGHWAQAAISKLHDAGIVKGYEDGTFRPENSLTRAEAVTMMNRLLGIESATGGVPVWNDVSTDHWAYGAIQASAQ